MDKTSLLLMIGGTAFVILLVILWKLNFEQKQREETQFLKEMYELALQDGNKDEALEYGRKYYSKLRRGEWSQYDEEMIFKDIAAFIPGDSLKENAL